jgi:hypothetical protein
VTLFATREFWQGNPVIFGTCLARFLGKWRESTQTLIGDVEMNPLKMLAIALIVVGGLGLAYGGFSYTKATHEAKVGPIVLSVKDTQTVNIPIWAGVGAIIAGMILLFARK